MKNLFYTYVLRDPRNFEPIYVGKGSNGRMFKHWEYMLSGRQGSNPKLYRKLTSIFLAGYLTPIYEKWLECSDAALCFWMERFLIHSIGRDALCNLTDGGDNPPSALGVVRSKEFVRQLSERQRGEIRGRLSDSHRKNISLGNLGKPKSKEHIEKVVKARAGYGHNEETRLKIGLSGIGRIHSEETRRIMSEAHKRLCSQMSREQLSARLKKAWVTRRKASLPV